MPRAAWSLRCGPIRAMRGRGGDPRTTLPLTWRSAVVPAIPGVAACARRKTGASCGRVGVLRELVEPERLVFTFAWDESGERGLETLVTVTFVEHGGKTVMTFRQTPFRSIAEREGHHAGWTRTFDRLAALLAQLKGSSQ